MKVLVSLLLLLATVANAQQQEVETSQAAVVPAAVVVPTEEETFQAPQPPAPAPAPAPTPAGLTEPIEPAAPVTPTLAQCPPFDRRLLEQYDYFFIMTRLVHAYTLERAQAGEAINQTAVPLTILAPSRGTVEFLQDNNLDFRQIAADPLQAVLLAPSVASHYIRGYYPASALPVNPVDTLCGEACGPVQFSLVGGEDGQEPRVQVSMANNASISVNVTRPNVAECPGVYVIHEVDGYLFNQVQNPLEAAAPALNVANALGGEFATYNLLGAGNTA